MAVAVSETSQLFPQPPPGATWGPRPSVLTKKRGGAYNWQTQVHLFFVVMIKTPRMRRRPACVFSFFVFSFSCSVVRLQTLNPQSIYFRVYVRFLVFYVNSDCFALFLCHDSIALA